MEEDTSNSSKTAIETNYAAHEENPGPARPAVKEKDDKKVGYTIRWVIIVAVVALAIVYLLFM